MKYKKISSLALIPLLTASSFAISQEGTDTKIEEVPVSYTHLRAHET